MVANVLTTDDKDRRDYRRDYRRDHRRDNYRYLYKDHGRTLV
jgi:hypothetical protein